MVEHVRVLFHNHNTRSEMVTNVEILNGETVTKETLFVGVVCNGRIAIMRDVNLTSGSLVTFVVGCFWRVCF